MTPEGFVKTLESFCFQDVFNPCSECCAVRDRNNADQMRRSSLLEILLAATESGVDSLWVGRDLGYRGGRRTGLAFTDDARPGKHAERWGVLIEKPTRDTIEESTATLVWDVLDHTDASAFLRNVFPLHPHKPQEPFTDRRRNSREKEAGQGLLHELIRFLKPQRLVAAGGDAAFSLEHLPGDSRIFQVRHPAHGGQRKFRKQMHEIYGFSDPGAGF